ncbi:hypothetical protein K6Y76_16580 [Burkholderia cenocepacia]|jgi:hypothetical protein|uniref:hypothetical protein n=1 Tax=Burkholderia TaxID=32008 RepID=UPI000F58502D|nr:MULTISPECIES: hypothetical protein [Burkholderia]MCG0581932.1 hypothetical protein [Burkholderia cenocepacia]MCW3524427.1 hypothetical protein [Burkholderia cenocepacia]MCW3614649.1 hypothetical protein [Burkholderia cenocepacia]MCW3652587.1 hypothetical protein [Burkholderia cenocepacia]MCW3667559.1 hypothetical protein [Burkholderia cenocepacia]
MSTKDKNSSLLDNAATNVRNEVAETAVAFLVDCRLTDRDLTAGIWEMALEYAYKPHPRFWRDIDLSAVVEAISLQYPNWRCAIATGGNAEEEVLHEVDLALFCNGFFEAMAEKMMELPKSARPRTGVAALQWICAELDRNGQVAELLLAQLPEVQCGKHALLLMTCLEQAELGLEMVRLGTQIARCYREKRMEDAA